MLCKVPEFSRLTPLLIFGNGSDDDIDDCVDLNGVILDDDSTTFAAAAAVADVDDDDENHIGKFEFI